MDAIDLKVDPNDVDVSNSMSGTVVDASRTPWR
jgi:hypothetical protein